MGMPALQHPPAVPLGPGQRLKIGYVSSDFGNHPLSHLMASVFGSHDKSKVGPVPKKANKPNRVPLSLTALFRGGCMGIQCPA